MRSPILHQAVQLFSARGVKENVEGICLVAQKIRGSPPHHHRISFLSNFGGDFFHHLHHAVSVESLTRQMSTALVTSPPEGFCQAVEPAVHALVTTLHGGGIDVCQAGDFLGETTVPERPSQLVRQLCRDGATPAAILSLNGDEAKHGFPSTGRPSVYRDSASRPSFFHEKYHGNHGQDGPGQQPEVVDIGQHCSLSLDRAFN